MTFNNKLIQKGESIVNKNLSVLFSLVLVLLLGSSFISKTHARTAPLSSKVVLNQAADRFYAGWAKGDWENPL
jgi:hypothetical protein